MIVFDSGSIISLALNCLCPVLKNFDVKFSIPKKVYEEIVLKPSEKRRYALESMRINSLIEGGSLVVIEPTTDLGAKLLDAANSIYSIHGKPLAIIHEAESDVMSLAYELNAKAMMIDERTLRMLCEDPKGLRKLLVHRNSCDVNVNKEKLEEFHSLASGIPILRSSELVAVAYERGFLSHLYGVGDKKVLEASLCALKYSGCSITWDEIDEYLLDEF